MSGDERAAEVMTSVLKEAQVNGDIDFDQFDSIAFWLESYRQEIAHAGLFATDAELEARGAS